MDLQTAIEKRINVFDIGILNGKLYVFTHPLPNENELEFINRHNRNILTAKKIKNKAR